MLAGISVPDRLVVELANRLRDAGFDLTAETLEDAYDRGTAVVALTIEDREVILRCWRTAPTGSASSAAR